MQHRPLLAMLLLYTFSLKAAVQSDPVPYDRLQQKSVHNAYQRKESLWDMLANRGMRSLELDIFVEKLFRPQLSGDWYVYHHLLDAKSSVDTLREGLAVLRDFHAHDPRHDVITLWIDLKQEFKAPDHRPEDLDMLLAEMLGEALLSPGELMAGCPEAENLQESVQREGCGWADAQALRGRFLVVFTGGSLLHYVANGTAARDRRGFIAPYAKGISEAEAQDYAVFFNLERSTANGSDLAQLLRKRHLISRTWDLNDPSAFRTAVAHGVHHLATNKVDEVKDPWSTTKQADGGLFAILPDQP